LKTKHSYRSILFVGIVMISVIFGNSGLAFAEDITIFSTTHNNEEPSEVEKPKGRMVVEISSFSPILEITLNGSSLPLQRETRATYKIDYNLLYGENEFTFFVRTKEDSVTKEFVLVYEEGKKDKKGPKKTSGFKLITLFGLQSTDNVSNSPDTGVKLAAKKLTLTLIPNYSLNLSKETQFVFQGILLREKFSDTEFKKNEIVFNQLQVDWERKTGFAHYKLGIGANDITNESAGIIAGENKVESGTIVLGDFHPGFYKALKLDFKYTLRAQPANPEEEYDGNGAKTNLNFGWDDRFSKVKLNLLFGTETNNAMGKYQDFKASLMKIGMGFSFTKTSTLSLSLNQKKVRYAEKDPKKASIAEEATTNNLSLKGNYMISKKLKLMLMGEVKQTNQSSNVDARNFKANNLIISLLHLY